LCRKPFGQPLNLFSRIQLNDAGFEFFAVFALSNPVKNRIAFSKIAETISEIDRDVVFAKVQILAATSAKKSCKAGAWNKPIDVGIFAVVCGVADERIIENQMDICGLPPLFASADGLPNLEPYGCARDPAHACLSYLVATNISSMKKDSLAATIFVVIAYESELRIA
jgi:hypothetical protein